MAKFFRFSAVIPVIFSAVAFALLLVLVVAGTQVGTGQDYYLLSLNTSKVGTGTIQFQPVSSQAPSSSNPLGGLLGGLGGDLGGLLNNVTGGIDNSLENLENELISNATKAVGIHDVYNLYLRNVCSGSYQGSQADIQSCPFYTDKTGGLSSIASNIPSSFVIGTTNVSVPLIASIGKSLGSVNGVVGLSTSAALALLFIGLVSSGMVVLLSLAAILLARLRILVLAVLFFAELGPLCLFFTSLIMSILTHWISSEVNDIGSALTINASAGSKAITLAWVAWALNVVSAVYWYLTWFVSYRRHAWVKVTRSEDEVGSFGKTFRATKRNTSTGNREKGLGRV